MAIVLRYACVVAMGLLVPLTAHAGNWIEFHAEKWDYTSHKVKKKLNFKSRSYYDADSLKRSPAGDVDVWVKEVSMPDRYYVGKGVPATEEMLKQMHFWCSAGKYEVITPDVADAGISEAMGEEVKPGSLYEKLFNSVCIGKEKK